MTDLETFRAETRAWLEANCPPEVRGPMTSEADMIWGGRDAVFATPGHRLWLERMGERGWTAPEWPREYGGGGLTREEAKVLASELRRIKAQPALNSFGVWMLGPALLAFGTEEQKQRFLPPICRGELSFSIGMSEPDSGSDLASVSTRATRAQDGWLLKGTNIWTSGAYENDWFVVLCRTSDDDGDRHHGLSQLLVDLHSDGLEIHPIRFLDGTSHFNEVVLNDVFVPDELVLGGIGMGWAQNTSELAYERGGPDRWLSTYLVVENWLREHPDTAAGERGALLLGDVVARWWALRGLSLSIARKIDRGEAPAVESALVKEMGTRFEQDVLERVVRLVDIEPSPESASLFERLLAAAILTGPSFTIRGGTIEVLRSVAAKGLES
jgi:alkylation response protein AidB-like acyl-CoA dehydrogenase